MLVTATLNVSVRLSRPSLTVSDTYRPPTKLAPRLMTSWLPMTLAVLPAHFDYSQLGMLDHHVFVALASTLLLLAALRLLQLQDDTVSTLSRCRGSLWSATVQSNTPPHRLHTAPNHTSARSKPTRRLATGASVRHACICALLTISA